jgi:transketolase
MSTETGSTPDRVPGDDTDARLATMTIEQLTINTIRTLSIDAVQAANSGHPGAPMALAPIAYLLSRQLEVNPRNPAWPDRDRFVLSAGHASMLLYSMLHLSGYELNLDDIRAFRQWGSKTPGHPEYGITPGVETTTGPLGQGLMTAVGMALAEAHLGAVYNRPDLRIVDHHTYVLASDGDMMEGASHEAGSLAGHLGLGKLIAIYDDNRITIDGPTDLAFSDDTAARFESYGWHTHDLGDASEDLAAMAEALADARAETARPSLILVRSHIGYGSPNKQDTSAAHGAPLGEDEVRLTKEAYGWPADEKFFVPERVRVHMREIVDRGIRLEAEWEERLESYRERYPLEAAELEQALDGRLAPGWDAELPGFVTGDGPIATRSVSGMALNALAGSVTTLMGGSADLAGSNSTRIKASGDVRAGEWAHRNVNWGIREHAMCAACSGMALHGGIRPFAATFLVFTDYARPAIRLAALMRQPVIYLMTHDSIGLGEDGPTHQPVDQLAALRAIPGLRVIRPADANETVEAWREAVRTTDRPTLLALSRQKLPVIALDDEPGSATGLARGAYILADAEDGRPDVILIATGSEVSLGLEARSTLAERGVKARVVSMPSWELFREQDETYRHEVLPPENPRRISVEAGCTQGWCEWIGDRGVAIGIDTFGASAPAEELFARFGFTVDAIVEQAEIMMKER